MPEKSGQIKRARDYAHLLLKFRPRSVDEVRKKLIKRGFAEYIIDEVVEDFRQHRLLDDRKFAKMWVQDRLSLKPMGRLRLRLELKAKGLDGTDIEEAVSEAMKDTDEYELARPIAFRRLRLMGSIDKLKRKKRVWDFLMRRGFTYDVVDKVVREVVK